MKASESQQDHNVRTTTHRDDHRVDEYFMITSSVDLIVERAKSCSRATDFRRTM